jgi:hypothetical protein
MPRITSFIVEGKGHFPVDMLRYDMAWPRDGQSASNLMTPEDRKERYTLRQVHLSTARKSDPTIGRWSSFGWTITAAFDEFYNPVPFL